MQGVKGYFDVNADVKNHDDILKLMKIHSTFLHV